MSEQHFSQSNVIIFRQPYVMVASWFLNCRRWWSFMMMRSLSTFLFLRIFHLFCSSGLILFNIPFWPNNISVLFLIKQLFFQHCILDFFGQVNILDFKTCLVKTTFRTFWLHLLFRPHSVQCPFLNVLVHLNQTWLLVRCVSPSDNLISLVIWWRPSVQIYSDFLELLH